ncbi:MAG: T9SS type A sorting domain-containing protein [Ignavibacteriae bacterium]|nr:T9SS type A sorting domain-containing protein [Ignavibacteriota bacterium]
MKRLILMFLILGILPMTSYSQLNNAVINRSDCGLNYIMKSVQITSRCPAHAGTSLPANISITELPANCINIESAYVWWTVSYNSGSPANGVVTLTNPQSQTQNIPAVLAGQAGPKCWSEIGTRCFRANVTNAITTNGNYSISVNTPVSETDGLTLMIIYKDKLATYQGSFVIYDGIITSTGPNSNQTLGGFNACDNAANAQAFSLVSDMQATIASPWSITVNGNPTNIPRLFWNSTVVNTNITKNQTSVSFGIAPVISDCYTWGMMGIYYQTTTCMTCPTGQITVTAGPQNQSVCPGGTANISATGAASYSWTSNPPGFTSTNASIAVNPLVTTTYTVTGTSADGCFTDAENVTVNVYPTPTANAGADAGICLGSSIQIGGLASGGGGNYTYSWSPSIGLSATDVAMPTANPQVTTTYNVTVTDGNGCTDQDDITVTVYPLPVLDAGVDRPICIGATTRLGQGASGGTPQYSFVWTPPAGLDNPNIQQPFATPNITTNYICTMTDANGCIDIDTVLVIVNPLPQPVITPSGPTTICSCDSVTLDAGNLGYTNYLWSPNQTTQTIVVRNPGQYTVTVTDTNGCVNTSAPITINVIYPSAEIALPQNYVHADAGEMVRIPLYIRNSKNLDTCNVRNFHAVINFYKTLLVPKGNTPQGTMVGDYRYIDLTGTRGTDDTLMYLDFMATLGKYPQTSLNISLFEWTDCPIPDSLFHSEFRLDNLCRADSIVRLYNYEGVPTSLIFKPNPVEDKGTLEFSLAETGPTQLILSNVIGQVVRKFIDESYEMGAYNLIFETSEIPSGLYYITLKTPTKVITKIMEVRK